MPTLDPHPSSGSSEATRNATEDTPREPEARRRFVRDALVAAGLLAASVAMPDIGVRSAFAQASTTTTLLPTSTTTLLPTSTTTLLPTSTTTLLPTSTTTLVPTSTPDPRPVPVPTLNEVGLSALTSALGAAAWWTHRGHQGDKDVDVVARLDDDPPG